MIFYTKIKFKYFKLDKTKPKQSPTKKFKISADLTSNTEKKEMSRMGIYSLLSCVIPGSSIAVNGNEEIGNLKRDFEKATYAKDFVNRVTIKRK